jgi:predicted aspartyl protease
MGAVRAGETCKPLSGVAAVSLTPDQTRRPVIPVTIAGQERAMILDTGASFTSISPDAVEDLKLTKSTVGKTISDITGNHSSEAALMPTLQLGRLRAGNIKAIIMPHVLVQDESYQGRKVIGLFGSDFLRGFDVDLDFGSQQLRLFSPDHCPGKVVFWHPKMLSMIPIELNRDGDVTLKMKLDGQELTALLDTGSNLTSLNADTARRLFDLSPEGKGTVNGTALNVSHHRFSSLAIEGLDISNPDIAITQDLAADRQGARQQWYSRMHGEGAYQLLVGMHELSKLHIYIDYREKMLFISPAGDEDLPETLKLNAQPN